MVDIHCHILPALDDGAQTLDEAVAMVRLATESGTTDIVATPHANSQFSFHPEQIDEAIEMLRKASRNVLRIHRGCDFHLTYENLQDALLHPTKYTINHGRYILVEFSVAHVAKAMDDALYRLRAAGMTPIITHPERNLFLQRHIERIRSWVEDGWPVQVTAQSFLGRFGESAKLFAEELMKQGLVHFAASDAHDTSDRTPRLSEAYACVAQNYGEAQAERVFVANPKATLTGERLSLKTQTANQRSKKWFCFK